MEDPRNPQEEMFNVIRSEAAELEKGGMLRKEWYQLASVGGYNSGSPFEPNGEGEGANGREIAYRPDGVPIRELDVRHGAVNGSARYYDAKGILVAEDFLIEGELRERRLYFTQAKQVD